MLTIQNLCKYYDKNKINEQYVLKNISFSLPNTGLISIFGPSGCGKTTLLNMLAGLDTPTSGTICYDDKPITDSFRYHNVGVIFQDYLLLEDKTVEENIRLGCLEATDQDLEDTLKALQISSLKDRKVSKLSGGEKQRVSIGRAIIKKPAYLVADEPTGNLDLKNRMRVMQILKSLSTHMLVILVSHDKELVIKYSDRIITLSDGEITNDRLVTQPTDHPTHEVMHNKHKFNLSSYLKDSFNMKYKTNFIIILCMITLTMLICFLSASVTGYKHQSANIENHYITLHKSPSYETFEKMKSKGHFQFDIDTSDITLAENKEFVTASKQLSIKNDTMKIYPYNDEKILFSAPKKYSTSTEAYLTLALANRLIKEGRLNSSNGFIQIKDLHFTSAADLLGSIVNNPNSLLEITGIVESNMEGILYTDSYYAIEKGITVLEKNTYFIPYSIYKKYNPQAPQVQKGNVLLLGFKEKPSEGLNNFGVKNNIYNIQDSYEEVLMLNQKKVQYVLNDYDYYEECNLKLFYTTHIDEVASLLDKENTTYELNALEMYKKIDATSKAIRNIILSITIILLIFSLFFVFLDIENYVNHQINDIIVLRCIGITKGQMIRAYFIKLLLKFLPNFILGFLISILLTFYIKSYNYQVKFMFQVNAITLLLSLVIGISLQGIVILITLFKKFKPTASTLKMKYKI